MKVLVTGASGFVGRALCAALAAQPEVSVRAAVRTLRGSDALSASVERMVIDSIGADTDWRSVLDDVTHVVHLAARVHVTHELDADPAAAFAEVNVRGTERLAQAAAAHGVQRFIFASSIAVHGSAHAESITEHTPIQPTTAYGQSKWDAERVLRESALADRLDSVVLRPPLVYGPGNPGNPLRLLRALAARLPLPLASIRNRRSFCYIGNLVDLTVRCLTHPRASGATFVVEDGSTLSTPELIVHLAAGLGVRPLLLPCPPALLRAAGGLSGRAALISSLIDSLTVDAAHARTALAWQPPHDPLEGLRATGRWYAETRREAAAKSG